jgi:hypothetical protein
MADGGARSTLIEVTRSAPKRPLVPEGWGRDGSDAEGTALNLEELKLAWVAKSLENPRSGFLQMRQLKRCPKGILGTSNTQAGQG